ncbi:hypothetical protein BABINDRAFT_131780 [Babjeviella inositovora NRRL Y-12698]|uniref:Uncharacterized protein n=1 Tax=Babjeviella inositovora NRRL Y-12698 TaxID=984486 RepID=A0A1E3QTQ7_9ASCO|nr:uncharacterized protein BABINDRAFT_131780 [Babjeviella inositovora NRRL Y-12698]ODQ80317.1 hypothetical protein BABINDRAFT_131780 [Babjeviella inositovora NRRL Y-12698]
MGYFRGDCEAKLELAKPIHLLRFTVAHSVDGLVCRYHTKYLQARFFTSCSAILHFSYAQCESAEPFALLHVHFFFGLAKREKARACKVPEARDTILLALYAFVHMRNFPPSLNPLHSLWAETLFSPHRPDALYCT